MEKYAITKQLGDGTFGSVLLATVKTTGEKVAIKKFELFNFLNGGDANNNNLFFAVSSLLKK